MLRRCPSENFCFNLECYRATRRVPYAEYLFKVNAAPPPAPGPENEDPCQTVHKKTAGQPGRIPVARWSALGAFATGYYPASRKRDSFSLQKVCLNACLSIAYGDPGRMVGRLLACALVPSIRLHCVVLSLRRFALASNLQFCAMSVMR